ncbi:BamA/TamA family outer membrane protein [Sodaliphilus sp.]|uniref:translocation and assembly module lipoprotein TamL n=1 Tax=Sodaliphilus sp. TaxID=2815818 RepID=UPI0038900217
MNKYLLILCLALAALLGTSCSTTSKLGANDVLYTGVKKLDYHQENAKLDADVQDQIFEAINVKPNNPLYSPYYRTPFPVGLWVYNHWDSKSKGVKGWLYKLLVARPVLISRVRPQARVDMINTLLQNNGYFTSTANYKLNYDKKNPKKASITYEVNVGKPYTIGEVKYMDINTPVCHIIDSLARKDHYLKTGSRYCLDSLNAVRINITNYLRNRGYYYFRPEYIQYLADSVHQRGVIDLQLVNSPDVPNMAHVKYVARDIVATVSSDEGGGVPDSIDMERCTLVKFNPVHIRDAVIPSNLRMRPGRAFGVNSMDRTQLALSRLGIFSNIDIQVHPVIDSITPAGNGVLDVEVNCVLDKPWEVKLELQGTSKSNSFIGPGLEAGLTHKNVFGGGEKLTGSLNASYEWQTGGGSTGAKSDMNSYAFGLDLSLALPRLLAPSFVDRSRRYINWTKVGVNADIMNRPSFFKMAQMGASFTWEWHANKKSLNEFTPFKLTYSKLLSRTEAFDSAMIANPAIALSFQDMFVPMMQYSYTYDNDFGRDHITWNVQLTEAGNVFAGIWAMCGSKGTKRMFGTPFSQFAKAQTNVVWTRRLGEQSSIVGRAFLGAAYAYGNSDEVPYREQFYIGGANSVRAFTVRHVGPGGYHPEHVDAYSYYDQTGTFKFETNWEYRFPIFSYFKGAAFIDAGNVWLLKDDEKRPDGKLEMKNFFKQLAVGTGVGLRFDMEMLVVRADLGVGLHLPYATSRSGWYNIPKFKDGLAFHLAIGYPF